MSELLKVPDEDLEELEDQEEEEAQEEDQEEEQIHPAFIVDNDMKAEWCLKQRQNALDEKAKWKAHYDELFNQVAKKCDETVSRMEAMLESFLGLQHSGGFTNVTKSGQIKYKLPHGTLVLKHQEPKYDVNDELLIPWLKKNDPDLVKVEEKSDWKALKKKVTVSGEGVITTDAELVPGITVTPREDVFKVEG